MGFSNADGGKQHELCGVVGVKDCLECVQEKMRRGNLKNRNSDTLLRNFDVKDDRDLAMLAEVGSREDLFFFLDERCVG